MKQMIFKYGLSITSFFIYFFAPIYSGLIACTILICADAITGVWASVKRGEKFESSKMKNSFSKGILYMTGLIIAHMLQTYMLPEIPFFRLTGGSIALIEFKSLLENIKDITGIELFKSIRSFIQREKPDLGESIKQDEPEKNKD